MKSFLKNQSIDFRRCPSLGTEITILELCIMSEHEFLGGSGTVLWVIVLLNVQPCHNFSLLTDSFPLERLISFQYLFLPHIPTEWWTLHHILQGADSSPGMLFFFCNAKFLCVWHLSTVCFSKMIHSCPDEPLYTPKDSSCLQNAEKDYSASPFFWAVLWRVRWTVEQCTLTLSAARCSWSSLEVVCSLFVTILTMFHLCLLFNSCWWIILVLSH